ncbi:DUF2784 domain-containing protein [Mycobacterium celatum]|uniref:DUF2784 domain-containing protein n=1 Tax=Mycobacterium celatum TaxID=28045 RepID=A0A1X1RV32_MYCCE|nr:DUF2784 domain-containing protein [Mycobacterium celatum]ORV18150.1 hypothetical protein AWB95_05025 [Mycobacterium celatum]PIB80623.1 DUF2784 domain-containing protein [Mycobacterium celatum]
MRRLHVVAVVAIVVAHFAYLIYLPSGGFLALRRPRTLVLHVPAVLWGVGVVYFGLPCPLTRLEQWARERAGLARLPESGFVDRYIAGVFYPADRTGTAQTAAFVAAAVSWLMLAVRHGRLEVTLKAGRGRVSAAPGRVCPLAT